MSTPQPSFKGLPIQINVFAEFVKKWALDNNTTYAKALKSKKMKKDFLAYRATLPLSKPIQSIQQFPPSSFVKADISPDQPAIPSDVADIAPEMAEVYPEEEPTESGPIKIRVKTKKRRTEPVVEPILYDIEEEPPKIVWQQYKSSTTGKPFWYNPETTESTYERPTTGTIDVIEGGKLSAPEIKSFVSASYIDHPDPTIDDWLLDTKLSNETAKVYYNPKQKRAVVIHRGTQGLSDWGNNLAYMLGGYEMTDRYKMGKDTQNRAEKKYGAKNISTLGHSQGAILARKLGANTKEIITVNPAYKFEKPLPNEFVIRSSSDVVSGAYAPVAAARSVLMPKKSQNRDITIPSENRFDVLGEHSSDILDRLPKDQMIGAGPKAHLSKQTISDEDFAAMLEGKIPFPTDKQKRKPKGRPVQMEFDEIEDEATGKTYTKEQYKSIIAKDKLNSIVSSLLRNHWNEDDDYWSLDEYERPEELHNLTKILRDYYTAASEAGYEKMIDEDLDMVRYLSDFDTNEDDILRFFKEMIDEHRYVMNEIKGAGAGHSVIVPIKEEPVSIEEIEPEEEEETPEPIQPQSQSNWRAEEIKRTKDELITPLLNRLRDFKYSKAEWSRVDKKRYDNFINTVYFRVYLIIDGIDRYIERMPPWHNIVADVDNMNKYLDQIEWYLLGSVGTPKLPILYSNIDGGAVGQKARPSKIQTILFSKDKWTKRKATAWLKKHNYSNKGVDDKPDTLRYRQLDPAYIDKIGYTQYITKPLGDSGVSLVIVYK